MSDSINILELGCKQQTQEFYEDLEQKFVSLDELDKTRTILHFMSKILSDDMRIHPLVIYKMLENLQNIEIVSAKMKKLLSDVKVSPMTCKHCGKTVPTMTMRMFCEGVNAKCPHDEIDVEITEVSS